MFRRLFAKRSPRPCVRSCSFRPMLEGLEERVVPESGGFPGEAPTFGPAGIMPSTTDASAGNYYGEFGPASLAPFGLPPSAYALYALSAEPVSGYPAVPFQQVSTGISGAGAGVGGVGGVGGGAGGGGGAAGPSVAQLEQLAATLFQFAESQNPQQATSLVIDEFLRGLDTVISASQQSLGMNNSSMQASVAAHQNSIDQNPLTHTPEGQLLGSLVYSLTVNAATSQS